MKFFVKSLSQWLTLLPLAGCIVAEPARSQPIVPAADRTNTVVTPDGAIDLNGTSGTGTRFNSGIGAV
jgi:hypothetical protein